MERAREPSVAQRLPPGSHGIPADVVARNQRERLIAAMAEVCAERGYAGTAVAGVAKRAGVSSVTFYKQFADKQDCMLAAHRQLLGRLLEGIDLAVEEKKGEEAPKVALHSLLVLLSADPPSARLLAVEILAAGAEGSKRHDVAVQALAERLNTMWVIAAGILALIGRRVMAGKAARLPELEDELARLCA